MSDSETKDQAGEQLADTQAQASADDAAAGVTGEASELATFGPHTDLPDLEDAFETADTEGQFKIFVALVSKYQHLSGQIEALAEKMLALDLRGTEDGGAVDIAILRLDELVAIRAERDGLVAKFKEIENSPKAKAAKAPKPRKVGPLEAELSTDDLFELVRSASRVEVAFSNGKTEIAHLPAQVIEGDAWRVGVNGLRLEGVTLSASGPASLAGYGLFLDGELAAYRARSDVLEITSGHTMSLAGDVVF